MQKNTISKIFKDKRKGFRNMNEKLEKKLAAKKKWPEKDWPK
jgi:hypothetical protein